MFNKRKQLLVLRSYIKDEKKGIIVHKRLEKNVTKAVCSVNKEKRLLSSCLLRVEKKEAKMQGKNGEKYLKAEEKKVAVDDSFLGNEEKINQSAHKKNVTMVVCYSVKRELVNNSRTGEVKERSN